MLFPISPTLQRKQIFLKFMDKITANSLLITEVQFKHLLYPWLYVHGYVLNSTNFWDFDANVSYLLLLQIFLNFGNAQTFQTESQEPTCHNLHTNLVFYFSGLIMKNITSNIPLGCDCAVPDFKKCKKYQFYNFVSSPNCTLNKTYSKEFSSERTFSLNST